MNPLDDAIARQQAREAKRKSEGDPVAYASDMIGLLTRMRIACKNYGNNVELTDDAPVVGLKVGDIRRAVIEIDRLNGVISRLVHTATGHTS